MNEVILIGGPNGAGKTTFVESYLKDDAFTYLGADQIAYELCPENVESVAVEAGRIFVERIRQFQKEPTNLIVESTLSGRSLARHIRKFKELGFSVKMVFISLPNAEVSAKRVQIRVKKGGHHVPAEDIERRFLKTHQNFWNLYRPLADNWAVFINGPNGHEIVADGVDKEYHVQQPQKWKEIQWKFES